MTRPGRGPSWIVGADAAGARLDKFLAADERLGSRAQSRSALERGKVYLNGREATPSDAGRRLAAGDELRVWTDRPGSASTPVRSGRFGKLEILFEDDVLLVVNKPAGLLSVPLPRNPGVPSIYDLLEARLRSHGRRRPLVVHRIDQETSGVVLFAKTPAAQARLQEQFKRRTPARVYQAVVHGRPAESSGTWRDYLLWDERALIQKVARRGDEGALEAIADYQVVETLRESALLSVALRTGRRNQIRIQAARRGHPLVGESRYVYEPPAHPIRFRRCALHAWRLGFDDPRDGRPLEFEAPRPPDLAELVERLRWSG
jgi:23S rRNA pseudouridine1911/1915/1917 synthase